MCPVCTTANIIQTSYDLSDIRLPPIGAPWFANNGEEDEDGNGREPEETTEAESDTINHEPREIDFPPTEAPSNAHGDAWGPAKDGNVGGPVTKIRRIGPYGNEVTEDGSEVGLADYERARSNLRKVAKGVRARCGMSFRFHEALAWETRRLVVEADSPEDAASLLDSHMDSFKNEDGVVDIESIVNQLVESGAPEAVLRHFLQTKGWTCQPPCVLEIYIHNFIYVVEVRFSVDLTNGQWAVFQHIYQTLWAVFRVECVEKEVQNE